VLTQRIKIITQGETQSFPGLDRNKKLNYDKLLNTYTSFLTLPQSIFNQLFYL